jgi:hypothetical protein
MTARRQRALKARFEPLLSKPMELYAELVRQSTKPHVQTDDELAYLLVLLVNTLQDTQRRLDELSARTVETGRWTRPTEPEP